MLTIPEINIEQKNTKILPPKTGLKCLSKHTTYTSAGIYYANKLDFHKIENKISQKYEYKQSRPKLVEYSVEKCLRKIIGYGDNW